jgi:hypothetical protein
VIECDRLPLHLGAAAASVPPLLTTAPVSVAPASIAGVPPLTDEDAVDDAHRIN